MRPMPAGLEPLMELALDLRWTWDHDSDPLWQQLAPEVWESTRNAWLILQTVSQRKLEACAADAHFVAAVARLAQQRAEYLLMPAAAAPLVAYFCLEYGTAEALPLYSGGLGILAGDHLKAASDLGVPMVAVGLLYQEGYFRQVLDTDGAQRELYPASVPGSMPITAERDADGAWLSIPLQLPGRTLMMRVWRAQVGRVPLLLLDCNDPLNSAADRGITSQLYGEGSETRLVQELVLGIGGWRVLSALGYEPKVCHINEGHAALAAIERARGHMRRHAVGFEEALWATRAGNIFTTHTPVAAAFDVYPLELMARYGRSYAQELGVDVQTLAALGRRDANDRSEPFNMAYLAMRTCAHVVGVSHMHGAVARELMQPLFPRRPVNEIPVGAITNGVHIPSWDSPAADRLWARHCGTDRCRGRDDEAATATAIGEADDASLWELARVQRQDLIAYARRRLARQLGQRSADPADIEAAAHVLDPNALTLGLARRFTAYKRNNMLLSDPERLARLLGDNARPLQLIVAGKAHPRDDAGKAMVLQWTRFANRADVRARCVFLEDYDIGVAQQLTRGVDAWLNIPRRGWEACGTSGMKVLVNGGLNISTLDGWWAEAYAPELGWAISGAVAGEGPAADAADAIHLYELLENEVVPLFYERDADGIPRGWTTRMRASMSRLTPRFAARRMLSDYIDQAYLPAATRFDRRVSGVALDLACWEKSLRDGWHQIRFGSILSRPLQGGHQFDAQVYCGEVSADALRVELFADAAEGSPSMCVAMTRTAEMQGAVQGYRYEARVETQRPVGDFTVRVVPYHPDAVLPAECPLILWQTR